MNKAFRIVLLIGCFAGTASACAPKVQVSTKDPIVINVNIKKPEKYIQNSPRR